MTTEPTARPRIVRFGTFEADLTTRELRKGGVKIKLQGQPFELLAMLLERPGTVVPREELQLRLWPTDTFVDFDHGVNTAINRLREALGDSADSPRFVETLPRRGYRFISAVEVPSVQAAAPAEMNSANAQANAAAPVVVQPAHFRSIRIVALAVAAALLVLLALNIAGLRDRMLGRHPAPHIQSLAVLPLVNLSGDRDEDYFADGMTEALTTDLGKISALRVISRTSVMQYKETKKTLPEIARELNVDALIEGTVSHAGNRLRITANLVQASPEKHLMAESFESEAGDVLAVQAQVAQAVAREIQVKLTPNEQKLLGNTRVVNPKAHDAYLKARYLCNKDTREGLDKAIQYFQRAIAEDPNDPLGYAGLAECYALWGWAGDLFAGDPSPKDVMPKARDAALKALQLDGNLAESHTSLAAVKLILDWDWSSAERESIRAIELNPNSSTAHLWYGHYLVAMGRFDESIAEVRRSVELDPLSQFTVDLAAWNFYFARRYDLTLQQSEKSLELFPEYPWANYHLGLVYEHTGRANEAVPEFIKAEERFGMSQDRLAELRQVYHQAGEKGYWREILTLSREASKQPRKFGRPSGYGWCDYMQDADVAAVEVRLGDYNAAFASLERGFANRGDALVYLNVDPYWDAIRSDPRFRELVRRVGLPH